MAVQEGLEGLPDMTVMRGPPLPGVVEAEGKEPLPERTEPQGVSY
jgi:hypothetical protein